MIHLIVEFSQIFSLVPNRSVSYIFIYQQFRNSPHLSLSFYHDFPFIWKVIGILMRLRSRLFLLQPATQLIPPRLHGSSQVPWVSIMWAIDHRPTKKASWLSPASATTFFQSITSVVARTNSVRTTPSGLESERNRPGWLTKIALPPRSHHSRFSNGCFRSNLVDIFPRCGILSLVFL